MYDSMDIQEIDSIQTDQQNLIDIRDKYEYILSHIKNAINIPGVYLMMMPENYLDKKKRYYIYCESGTRSRKLCLQLIEKGYQVTDLIGGYQNYRKKPDFS